MPRPIPSYDMYLREQTQLAIGIAKAGEISRSLGDMNIQREWSRARLESLYELSYLRIFNAWEYCLESIFFRSLCGYASNAGQETLVAGNYYRTITSAETAVLGGSAYMLWHDPTKIINRLRTHIRSQDPNFPQYIGRQESVISLFPHISV